MDVTPLIRRDTKVIQSYRDSLFKISNQTYTHPVIVLHDRVIAWPQGEKEIGSLTLDDFALLKDLGGLVDVLLLGTGAKQIMPSVALRQAVKSTYGITIEAMDTGAASRTYNVLVAEGRLIAAALI
jgi:uncharacterized protein